MTRPHRSTLALLLAGVAALSVAAAVAAQPGPGGPGPMGPFAERFVEERFDRLADYLELTESQRVEAEALRDRWLGDARQRIESAAGSFETIHEMALAENPDANAIGEMVIRMVRDREAAREAHDGYRAELLALLTPEQAQRFEAWEAARPWADHPGPGRHHGPHGPFAPPDRDGD
ncbi:MAG: Spy/CpxP family protein refolding chaperone [Thermoanaerobaculia bacterium]